jgi:hypothetical protein
LVNDPGEVAQAWEALALALQSGGRRLADHGAKLTGWEQADGYRALLRALHNQLGRFEVDRDRPEPLETVAAPPPIEPGRFAHQLRRLAATIDSLVPVFAAAAKADAAQPNALRPWSEMTGGGVYTEPGISYLRGGWQLDDGEALVIEGDAPRCRYWNILLYSRFLNSLDHRHRKVSATGATATVAEGRYRFVLAAQDPGLASADWLDTEGRPSASW